MEEACLLDLRYIPSCALRGPQICSNQNVFPTVFPTEHLLISSASLRCYFAALFPVTRLQGRVNANMCFSSEDTNEPQNAHPRPARPRRNQQQQQQRPRQTASVPLTPMRPAMTPGTMSAGDLSYVARVIDFHLRAMRYAFIGGVACYLLGSEPHDFDIIVPNGTRGQVMSTLAKDTGAFGTAQGGIWAKVDNRRYNVDVIEPRQIGQSYTGDEAILTRGYRILHPRLLLDFKKYSLAHRDRNRDESMQHDRQDIGFLNQYLKGNQGK